MTKETEAPDMNPAEAYKLDEQVLRSIIYWANCAVRAGRLEDAVIFAANARNHAQNALAALRPTDTEQAPHTETGGWSVKWLFRRVFHKHIWAHFPGRRVCIYAFCMKSKPNQEGDSV